MTPPPAPPPSALWGDETRRIPRFFAIGPQRMPPAPVHAMADIKASATQVNGELGPLSTPTTQAIAAAEVAGARHDAQFPLSVWQTGSGAHCETEIRASQVVPHRLETLAGRERWPGLQPPLTSPPEP